MKISTFCDSMNKWQAWVEGTLDGENGIRGQGDSEEEAVADLLERLGVKV